MAYMCMATVIRNSIPMVKAALSSLLLFMSRFACVLYGEVSSAVMSRIMAVTPSQRLRSQKDRGNCIFLILRLFRLLF